MLIVDAHMHVLDYRWIPEGIRKSWARAASGSRNPEVNPEEIFPRIVVGQSDPDGSRTIAAFDRAGVNAGIIPVVDWTIVGEPVGQHLPIQELHNQHISLAESWPGRFFFCAGVDPRHDDAQTIAKDSLESDACLGMKLYPAAGWDTDDPRYQWVFDLALEYDASIVIHTSPIGGEPLETPRSRPAALAGILSRNTNSRIVFAHAGFEAWWLEALDIAAGHWRTYLELSLWQDLADHDYPEFRNRIRVARRRLGAHRLIFGSDIIRGERTDPDGDDLMRYIDQFHGLAEPFDGTSPVISKDELEMIMAGSALNAFQLDPNRVANKSSLGNQLANNAPRAGNR